MIEIVHDPYELYQPVVGQKSIYVTWVGDYSEARRRIYHLLNAPPPRRLTVVVRSEQVWRWLQDLRDYEERTTERLIAFKELSVRSEWRRQYEVEPPLAYADMTLAYLLAQNLPAPSVVEQDDLAGWVLGHQLDPLWRTTAISNSHWGQVVLWFAREPEIPAEISALVIERLRAYGQQDERYTLFAKGGSSSGIAHRLLWRYALQRYSPTFLASADLLDLPLLDDTAPQTAVQKLLQTDKFISERIRDYWRTQWATVDAARLPSLIAQMSGYVHEEAVALRELFSQWADLLTPLIAQEIESKFGQATPITQKLIADILRQMAPPLPPAPQEEWEVGEWLQWATHGYLPYFAWVIANKQKRDDQLAYGEQFARWYLTNYRKLWQDDDSPLLHTQVRQVMQAKHDVILWLIVDSLAWWEGNYLIQKIVMAGLGVNEMPPALAVLPSLTTISKRALIEGSFPIQPSTMPLRRLVETTLHRSTGLTVYTQATELAERLQQSPLKPGHYVLLYNVLDSYHHQASGLLSPPIKGMLDELQELASTLFEKAEREGITATVFVSSDHGVTLLPDNAPALPLPISAREVEEEVSDAGATTGQKRRKRTRVGTILQSVPPAQAGGEEWAEWAILYKEHYHLPATYLIPKGYASVGGKLSGWTHGGATPEEVVVPFFQVEPTPLVSLTPPNVSLAMGVKGMKQVPLNMPFEVMLTIKNLNPFALLDVAIRILEIENISLSIGTIGAQATFQHEWPLPPVAPSGMAWQIHWKLTCRAGRRVWPFEGTATFPVARMTDDDYDPFDMG